MDLRLQQLLEVASPDWMEARVQALLRTPPPSGPATSRTAVAVGCESRRDETALLLADWACYEGTDRVTLARLRVALAAFPQGFRSWWLHYPEDGWQPVGYSGWHPISEATFRHLESEGGSSDRTVAPLKETPRASSYLYLFNYSVIPALRGGEVARQLLSHLGKEIRSAAPRALAAITVSKDGARVAQRFGLRPSKAGLYLWREPS